MRVHVDTAQPDTRRWAASWRRGARIALLASLLLLAVTQLSLWVLAAILVSGIGVFAVWVHMVLSLEV